MYQTIKKNIHIVIIAIGALFHAHSYAMLERIKLASMNKETLQKIDELPRIAEQIFQQFTEIVQGSQELRTFKKIHRDLSIPIQEIESFAKKHDNKGDSERKDAADQTEQILIFISTLSETLDSIQTKLETLKDIKAIDIAPKVDEENKASAEKEKKENHAKIPGLLDGKQTLKLKIKHRTERVENLLKGLENLRLVISSFDPGDSPKIPIKQADLGYLKDMLVEYRTTIDTAIQTCRTHSAGIGVSESLETLIKDLTEGLHDVVHNFSQSISVDFKEVLGFPILLTIRKELCQLIREIDDIPEDQKQQKTTKLLNISMGKLVDLIETLREGTLYNRLVTLNGKFQAMQERIAKLNHEQITRDLIILDKDLEEILTTRSGLLGVLETITDSMKEKLNQVVDNFNAKTNKTIDTTVPKTAKKIMYYVPFAATATLSALWLTHQWFNDRLDQTGLLKGGAVFLASIAALPCVDKIVNWMYPIAR